MFGTIHHAGYLTDDLDKTLAFCENAFRGRVTARTSQPDGTQVAFFKAGESEMEIIQPADPTRLGGRTGLIFDHVGYFVANLDEAMKELEAKGIKFSRGLITNPLGFRIAYMDAEDTLGTRIHLTGK